MTKEYLSNIELYFTPAEKVSSDMISLNGDDFKHAVKVMRNRKGDKIYITNGTGFIFKSEIEAIESDVLSAKIIEIIETENKFQNIFFCIPKLKNPDRFKFALEKCVELGIVNFIVFESERTIKSGAHIKRWKKIALTAMKQSLQSYLPSIEVVDSLSDIRKLSGNMIVFDQNAERRFSFNHQNNDRYYFIFGPEGGLSDNELNLFDPYSLYNLSGNRLRTETAVVKAASSL